MILLHPYQHVDVSELYEHSHDHHEAPSDGEHNKKDCIECILISTIVSDLNISVSGYLNQEFSIIVNDENTVLKKRSVIRFSLRAPPVFYV